VAVIDSLLSLTFWRLIMKWAVSHFLFRSSEAFTKHMSRRFSRFIAKVATHVKGFTTGHNSKFKDSSLLS
jgi:hypothetical protein